jgi:hypothetical protein
MNDLVSQGKPVPEALEVGTLARELAASYRSSVEFHKKQLGLPAQEAVAQAEAPCAPTYEESILNGPPDMVSWHGLEHLARKDPELALQGWERVKREARAELVSGHRAARVMEGYESNPWERARFLAVRRDLMEAWQPRNGLERQLIDVMAQAQSALFFWQQQLMVRASIQPGQEKRDIQEERKWKPPRVSAHRAIEQTAAMVDRFNRMYLRTLRALRDLRRYTPAVIVQNAGQVNVGAQQVNVATS